MSAPQCRYFGLCGGCTAQHIDYNLQLRNKKQMLQRILNFNIEMFPGNEYFYRSRMEFVFHSKGLGLRMKNNSARIIDTEKCVISNEGINELLSETRGFFTDLDSFDLNKRNGTYRYAVIRSTGTDSSVSFVLNSKSTRINPAVEKIKEFSKTSSPKNIIITYVEPDIEESVSCDYFVVKGSDMIRENYLGMEFFYPVQGFFQNNHDIAEKMQLYIKKICDQSQRADVTLLDLYGGAGTFGLINSGFFMEVIIIDNLKSSIEAADLNIKNNHIRNAKAICMDAKGIRKAVSGKNIYVIADPPRSGMERKTIEQLRTLRPEKIIYISCNPWQLVKDIKNLKYEIWSASFFDMFPQTPHIEAIVELYDKGNNRAS